ncbi:MAG: hypothetical protein OXI27_07690 [Thaumarchaeota archaeon]|nr:hypothetical protein [Nitrososphaerota archaeon]
MAATCTLKEAERKTFRGMYGCLRNRADLCEWLGFADGRIPSKGIMQRPFL